MALMELLDPMYLKSKLDSYDSRLDVNLSTRASESTLSGFSGKFRTLISTMELELFKITMLEYKMMQITD